MVNTPLGFPRPVATDRVRDGYDAISDLADAVDALVGAALPIRGAWTVFNPAWTNLTLGDGAQAGAYIKVGRLVVARYKLVFGATTTLTAGISADLPVAAHANAVLAGCGYVANYRDASLGASFLGFTSLASANAVFFLRANVAGANDQIATITNLLPFVWAVGDVIGGQVAYESAA